MTKFDIITIGDASEDVFLQLLEAEVHCNKGTNKCELCMIYADKIPIGRVDRLVGGNSINLAIGMNRLGFKSAFVVVLGNDEQGSKVMQALKQNKVSTKYVQIDKKSMTNHSTILNLNAERTILIYHVDRKYKLPKLDKAKWLYYSSMGHGFEVIHKELLKYLKKYNVKLGFNPGTHQLRKAKSLKEFFLLSDVILLNKEEAQLVLKTKSNNFKELLKGLKKLGAKIAVVTDGPKGSYAYDGSEFYFQNIYDCPVVERTGCGDSYSTGFIAALMSGHDIKEAMRWGTVNAASVIQQIGPQPGLIKLAELKKILKSHPKFKPRKF
ncbi:hypothetical protein CMO88_05035 [Candidatus Woesearchaeota archaeon]|nr:hypothetical protein [Candidatus Woesearchaeota archaeon]|tara:strand:+ start:6296 stop:7267 length:972 start_codon:yes stop_codon:yes gene_type:complete